MKRVALFRSAKDVTLIAAMSATLIAAQYALQMVAGVEIVTALFSAYCFVFGVRRGLTVATCFSMLRCFLYGFTLSVIALYLIYFNLFALVFGLLGKATAKLADRRLKAGSAGRPHSKRLIFGNTRKALLKNTFSYSSSGISRLITER